MIWALPRWSSYFSWPWCWDQSRILVSSSCYSALIKTFAQVIHLRRYNFDLPMCLFASFWRTILVKCSCSILQGSVPKLTAAKSRQYFSGTVATLSIFFVDRFQVINLFLPLGHNEHLRIAIAFYRDRDHIKTVSLLVTKPRMSLWFLQNISLEHRAWARTLPKGHIRFPIPGSMCSLSFLIR